jgi:hypothetical protein
LSHAEKGTKGHEKRNNAIASRMDLFVHEPKVDNAYFTEPLADLRRWAESYSEVIVTAQKAHDGKQQRSAATLRQSNTPRSFILCNKARPQSVPHLGRLVHHNIISQFCEYFFTVLVHPCWWVPSFIFHTWRREIYSNSIPILLAVQPTEAVASGGRAPFQ